jgi:hypothetical protein
LQPWLDYDLKVEKKNPREFVASGARPVIELSNEKPLQPALRHPVAEDEMVGR